MAYQYKDQSINKISIIGAGNIGPDIAFLIAKRLFDLDVTVLLEDVSPSSLIQAQTRIEQKIEQFSQNQNHSSQQKSKLRQSFHFSNNMKEVIGSDMIIETATENPSLKNLIFKQLKSVVKEKCIKLSNSSYITPETIFDKLDGHENSAVVHYFYPADKNEAIEIISLEKTDPDLIEFLFEFNRFLGKDPLYVKSSYGYAINPIFAGLCQIAFGCLEKGLGTVQQIDQSAKDILGLLIGPFTALNLSGGNLILEHGLLGLRDSLSEWFVPNQHLSEIVLNGELWKTSPRDQTVIIPEEKSGILRQKFLDGYFALTSFIMDLEICDPKEFNRICSKALSIKAPLEYMSEIGIDNSLMMIKRFCKDNKDFTYPIKIENILKNRV
ncbi:MAG: 3-hydroxyacyl-CoA dehydrogenase family protein [Deltaproteobacteria bacterium]|nr:3-hydroxyacyl-CoA dehydrogenase family protein [Deltaproteobacteria bacterium]